jgi:arylsulfatase A-like enzyme
MKTNFYYAIIFSIFCYSIIAQDSNQKNVLLIIVDDLRPVLPTYGATQVEAPHLTAFSKNAVQFNNAYVNIPTCGASRASILTGIRPTREYYKKYYTSIDEDMPQAITISELLQAKGYTTISNGKVSHNKSDKASTWDDLWRPGSTTPKDYLLEENIESSKLPHKNNHMPYEKANVEDLAYKDGKIAAKTIRDLKKLKAQKESFFLVAGFLKPHLPFNAPAKYWEMYDKEKITPPINNKFPATAYEGAGNWYELARYKGVQQGYSDNPSLNAKTFTMDAEMTTNLIHGYYACVSYIDQQIGNVLQALENLELSDNTIVIITSDHGFSLSDHNRWSKHNLFKVENHVPLFVRVPGLSNPGKSDSFVELIDLYPTICDLLGLEKPDQLEGRSLVENIKDPNLISKTNAFSRYTNGDMYISDNYAYSEWKYSEEGNIVGRMLYDMKNDPFQMENLSHLTKYEKLMDSLSNNLKSKKIY